MSEAAPGIPDSAAFVSEGRQRLATALRALIDVAMTTPEASEAELVRAADAVDAARDALPNAGEARGPGYAPKHHGDYLPRSPVVGAASPLAPGTIEWEIVTGHDGRRRCVVEGHLGAVYEGPPGYVHGGVVALVFDEILGIVNIANDCPGMTGSLTVRYRRPTPLFTPLRWEAWLDHVEGRRIQSRAQVWAGETMCAEAEGLFIQPRPELRAQYFGASEEA